MELTWKDVLAREELRGGDIEYREDGITYRGPLTEITEDGELIIFSSPWCARFNHSTGKWRKWNITSLLVSKDVVKPQDIGEGRIFLLVPLLGSCTIFPKGGSKLDPAKVEGLELSPA